MTYNGNQYGNVAWQDRLLNRYKVNKDKPSTKGISSIYSFCWEWQGKLNKENYGILRVGKRYLAHIMSYIYFNGEYPRYDENGNRNCVTHLCNNPCCINPDHLELKDDAGNVRDRERSGRTNTPRGEKARSSKLVETQVLEIRDSSLTLEELGSFYGVTKQAIWAILHRKSWKHI